MTGSLLRRATRTAERRLFAPAPASRPAVARVVLGAYTAAYVGKRVRMFSKIHRTDPELFAPVGPVRVLRRPLPPKVADGLVMAELAADVAFTLGLAHRVTGPAHAGLLLWTLAYRNSWSMVFHSDNTLVLHTAIAGLARSADALSVDALVRGRGLTGTAAPDWRYGYPARVSSAVTVAAYFLSGVAKVRGPLGWGWASGDALRSQIAADGLRKELLGTKAAPLGVQLYERTRMWQAMAVGSLATELLAPLTLLDRRVARAWAAGAFGMHWGIKAIMGITFRYQLTGVAYTSFLPTERLADPATWRALLPR